MADFSSFMFADCVRNSAVQKEVLTMLQVLGLSYYWNLTEVVAVDVAKLRVIFGNTILFHKTIK
jgi:hypothetical protein